MIRRIIPLLLVALILGACSRVTQDNFDKIKNGMSGAEVRDILGEPTESESMDLGILRTTSSVWKDGGATISITFAGDKVKMKSFNKEQAQGK